MIKYEGTCFKVVGTWKVKEPLQRGLQEMQCHQRIARISIERRKWNKYSEKELSDIADDWQCVSSKGHSGKESWDLLWVWEEAENQQAEAKKNKGWISGGISGTVFWLWMR